MHSLLNRLLSASVVSHRPHRTMLIYKLFGLVAIMIFDMILTWTSLFQFLFQVQVKCKFTNILTRRDFKTPIISLENDKLKPNLAADKLSHQLYLL